MDIRKQFRQLARSFSAGCILLMALAGFVSGSAAAERVRKPVWEGRFYPETVGALRAQIAELTRQATETRTGIHAEKPLRALILPHAGYIYSGATAAHASRVLKGRRFSKVIVVGPDHRVGFKNVAVSDVDAYETLLGRIPLHADARRLRRQADIFQVIPASDAQEHSIEVVLPFLQYYLSSFALVPMVMGRSCQSDRIRTAVADILDEDTLLVVSSDLSHYLPYAVACQYDSETLRAVTELRAEVLLDRENGACGMTPILMLVEMAKQYHWQPMLLHYENSGDTAGEKTRVVGYAAIAFYGDAPMKKKKSQSMQKITQKEGKALVTLARKTIMERFGRKVDPSDLSAMDAEMKSQKFSESRGVFVTLNKDGHLRGCIGSLVGTEALADGVQRHAVNAAFHDHRFPQVSEDELDDLEIEVSVLTEPKPLEYQDAADLMAKLRPNVDGVIIHKGAARATFLPQVWEQLPQPEDFLSHLCLKAGLSGDAWQTTKLEVQIYQVQYFEEKK